MTLIQPSDISIVVAAYGNVPYLEETLNSIIRTQEHDLPVFVLDDASPTDDVKNIAQKFRDRITYIRSSANRGVSGSFNAAAELVQTKYLMLVGPDDRLTTSIAESLNNLSIDLSKFDVFQPGVNVIDENGDPFYPLTDRVKTLVSPKSFGEVSGPSLASSLLRGNWTYNPSLIWNVEVLKEFKYDESLKTAMDLDLLLRLSFKGKKLFSFKKTIFEYRRHAEAVSSQNAGIQRLTEELNIHLSAAHTARLLGWHSTRIWAHLAPTARVHALKLLKSGSLKERLNLLSLAVMQLRSLNRI